MTIFNFFFYQKDVLFRCTSFDWVQLASREDLSNTNTSRLVVITQQNQWSSACEVSAQDRFLCLFCRSWWRLIFRTVDSRLRLQTVTAAPLILSAEHYLTRLFGERTDASWKYHPPLPPTAHHPPPRPPPLRHSTAPAALCNYQQCNQQTC